MIWLESIFVGLAAAAIFISGWVLGSNSGMQRGIRLGVSQQKHDEKVKKLREAGLL